MSTKAWDLDRFALEDLRCFHAALRPKGITEQTNRRRSPCSTLRKMHLPSGERPIHLSSVAEQTVEQIMPGNGVSKPQETNLYMQRPDQDKGRTPKLNEAHIPLPKNWTADDVLDTVLTAWTILIVRYQRDTFYQFTWGIRDASKDSAQCISAPELDLSNQTAKSLKAKVGSLRTKEYAINEDSLLFLNDGTSAEVCTIGKPIKHH
jgi:hypothetical protein